MAWTVFNERDVEFESVDWGRTKVLVGREAPEERGRTDKVLVKITEYLPGFVHEMHVHEEQDEVILVLAGTGVSETPDGRRSVKPGDIVHVPAGTMHSTSNPGLEPLRAAIVKAPPD